MVASAISFRHPLQWLPDPVWLSGVILTPGPPQNVVSFLWDRPMDTGVLPGVGSFLCVVDGFPRAVTAPLWIDPTHLRLDLAGNAPTIFASCSLIAEDPNLRSTDLITAKPIQVANWYP